MRSGERIGVSIPLVRMDRYRVPSKQSGNIYEGLYTVCQEEARGFSTQALSVRRTYKSLNTSCKEGQVESRQE